MKNGNSTNEGASSITPDPSLLVPNSTTQQSNTSQIDTDATKPNTSSSALESAASAPPALATGALQPAAVTVQEQPLFPTWIPILLSCIAIVLAVINFTYTFRKDRRARKQSIQDDYWFRKIASPITIEPLVKNLLTISSELPATSSINSDAAKTLWQEQTKRVEEFRSSIGALALLSKELPNKLIQHIDAISDELAEFYGQYIQDIESGSKNSNCEKTKGALLDSMIRILESIQSHQEKVGYSGWIAKFRDKTIASKVK